MATRYVVAIYDKESGEFLDLCNLGTGRIERYSLVRRDAEMVAEMMNSRTDSVCSTCHYIVKQIDL